MVGTEEVLINDSGTSKKFSTQRFLDVKTACETSETNASNSAVAAAASAASAASVYDSFDDRYLGVKASDPTTDNDGDPLVQGMLYFDSTNSLMKVYDGSAWITTSSATLATLDVYKFTATAGQTIFTGTDDDGNTLSIKPTAEIVFINGVAIEPTTDYSVTATTLTLVTGAALNDEVNVYAFGNFELADHYSKTASDDRYYTKTQADANYQPLATVLTNTTASYTTAEETKLAGIETGATADQTGAEIKTAYEAEADTNAFTDADHTKLDGIEASANNYSHPTGDGNLHVPATGTTNDGKYLMAGATAGSLSWTTVEALPDQTGHSGQFLQTNGTVADWATVDLTTKVDKTGDTMTGTLTAPTLTSTGTVNAVTVDLGNWTVTESAGVLYFATSGVNKMKLDASGNLTCTGNVIAFGTV